MFEDNREPYEIYDRNWLGSVLAAEDLRELSDEDEVRLRTWLSSFQAAEVRTDGRPDLRTLLREAFVEELHKAGIFEGRIAELGGPNNSFARDLPDYDFTFLSLYPVQDRPEVVVADITQRSDLPSESFDAIFSVSVLEHVSKPWRAAEEMTRLLKVGGLSFHAAPFSYFYHGAPADFWRYTPDALTTIFSSLRPVVTDFFGANRRRDNRGSASNAVDRDGGSSFAVDALGGWRENWYSIYAGIKDPAYLSDRLIAAQRQVVVNLMKVLVGAGGEPVEAAKTIANTVACLTVNQDHELSRVEPGAGMRYTEEEVLEIWRTRSAATVMPSYSRFVMARMAGLDPSSQAAS